MIRPRPEEVYLLRSSEEFDGDWYLSQYRDVKTLGMDPVEHYLWLGARLLRDPGPAFSTGGYLRAYRDVAAAGLNPLVHYLRFGRAEGRLPKPQSFSAVAAARRGQDGVVAGLPRSRGTILIVSHDAEIGGAQQVALAMGRWLLRSTQYDVKFVLVRGGARIDTFAAVADTFNLENALEGDDPTAAAAELAEWAGPDVRTVLVNSIASGPFYNFWRGQAPSVAFIHEQAQVLDIFPEAFAQVVGHADLIVCGSPTVHETLVARAVDPARLRTLSAFVEPLAHEVSAEAKRAAKVELGYGEDTLLMVGCGVAHWRKGPKTFVQVCAEVCRVLGDRAAFLWVGGGPDEEECLSEAERLGVADRIRFTGMVPDIAPYMLGADVFLLTSLEDPFPLAALAAAQSEAPMVCFAESGGIPGLASQGCGAVVPMGDVAAMAAAVLAYAGDADLLRGHGQAGRALIRRQYEVDTVARKLLHFLREPSGEAPAVSIIVPCYNHEKFIQERLDTIAEQTFQDYEVILLDDKSSDGSVPLLRRWAGGRPYCRVIVNQDNSGSPFRQWLRGLREARGELIWIAEGDDSCEPQLLETLVPGFVDRNVFLAHVKSVPVGAAGNVLGDYDDLYLNALSQGRWTQPYVATDLEEVNAGLAVANTIPNASGVVFRRFDVDPGTVAALEGMRMCGDWLFYLRAMRGGLVFFSEKPLNRHRRHEGTVTHGVEGSPRYFTEIQGVHRFILENFPVTAELRAAMEAGVARERARFADRIGAADTAIVDQAPISRGKPALLVVIPDLGPGGGQIFGIELANAWVRAGGRCVLVNVGRFPDHPNVVSRIDARVPLFDLRDPEVKLDAIIRRFGIEVIQSSIWWSDRAVQDHVDLVGRHVPWVVTMHGCYETLAEHPETDPSYVERQPRLIARVDAWVWTADKHQVLLDGFRSPGRTLRIDNGVAVRPARPLSRAALGVREESLLVCLAARAIPEKGFLAAADMTARLNAEGVATDLLLIGEGPAADQLREQARPHIRLVGHVDNLQDYIAACDIGLLPSSFIGESLPLVLLEMMAFGKPVIATDVGEIPKIVRSDDGDAGIVVPLVKGMVDVDGFVAAIKRLASAEERATMGAAAQRKFDTCYTIDRSVADYDALYRELLAGQDETAGAVAVASA